MEQDWDQIVRIALAGTDRIPPAAQDWPGLPFSAETQADNAFFALKILSAQHLLHKSKLPLEHALHLPVGPGETAGRPCPPEVETDLMRILSGPFLPALVEFSGLLRQAGLQWPPAALPDMLQLALTDARWRAELLETGNPLIPWLARQHPQWQKILPPENTDWSTGKIGERKDLLRRLRRENPGEARRLLQGSWAQEPAAHREVLLAEMRENIAVKDLFFLEEAASDRSRAVRLQACRLLAGLPEGAKSEKWRRMLTAVNWSGKAPEPPRDEDFSAELNYLSGLHTPGDALSGLEMLLSLLPPALIAAALGWSPAQLLKKWTDAPDYARFVPALIEAAVRHGDLEWMHAACEVLGRYGAHPVWRLPLMADLLDAMLPADWATRCQSLCLDTGLLSDPESGLSASLLKQDKIWSAELFNAFTGRLKDLVNGAWIQPAQQYLRHILQAGAYRCRPEVVESACRQRVLPDAPLPNPWQAEMQQCIAVARFRMAMQAHFKP